MLQPPDTALFASAHQVQALSEIIRSNSDRVLRAWLSAAESLVGQDGASATPVPIEWLRAEGASIIDSLPAELQGTANGSPPRPRAPLPIGLASPTLLCHLYALLSNCVITVASGQFPADWAASVGIDLHIRLTSAIVRLSGISPGLLATDLEASVVAQHQRLARALDHLVDAEEGERQRIARDIHDVIAQALTAAHLQAEAASGVIHSAPSEAAAEVASAQELISSALGQVRDIIFDLRPASLERLGLTAAISDYAEHVFAGTGTVVSVDGSGETAGIGAHAETALYRVIQETLANARKHARATMVAVSVSVGPQWVEATVQDNGTGFDVSSAPVMKDGQHCGLGFARERIRLIGGECTINSIAGNGTTLHIRVPK